MEEVVIPGWVWGLFTVVIVAWMVRLTFMAFKAEKDVSLQNSKDQQILNDISHLNRKLDDTKTDLHESLDKLDTRFEKFEARMDKLFDRAFDLLNKATKS
jgi:chromosome segregation ATPase